MSSGFAVKYVFRGSSLRRTCLEAPPTLAQLRDKLAQSFPDAAARFRDPVCPLALQFEDDEGDTVTVATDDEFVAALGVARDAGRVLRVTVLDDKLGEDGDYGPGSGGGGEAVPAPGVASVATVQAEEREVARPVVASPGGVLGDLELDDIMNAAMNEIGQPDQGEADGSVAVDPEAAEAVISGEARPKRSISLRGAQQSSQQSRRGQQQQHAEEKEEEQQGPAAGDWMPSFALRVNPLLAQLKRLLHILALEAPAAQTVLVTLALRAAASADPATAFSTLLQEYDDKMKQAAAAPDTSVAAAAAAVLTSEPMRKLLKSLAKQYLGAHGAFVLSALPLPWLLHTTPSVSKVVEEDDEEEAQQGEQGTRKAAAAAAGAAGVSEPTASRTPAGPAAAVAAAAAAAAAGAAPWLGVVQQLVQGQVLAEGAVEKAVFGAVQHAVASGNAAATLSALLGQMA